MQGNRKTLILLVEDDADIMELLKEVFTKNGYQCLGVTTGADAMRKFDEFVFDLVVLNHELPNTDGYHLYKQIREKNRGIPILFHTSHVPELKKKISGEFPDDDKVRFVTKPSTLDALTEAAKELLG